MPVTISVKKKTYESTNKLHAEQVMLAALKLGDITCEMNAWPCVDRCHEALRRASIGRTITVSITDDHGGYAADHGRRGQTEGTITYRNGAVEYG